MTNKTDRISTPSNVIIRDNFFVVTDFLICPQTAIKFCP